MASASSEAAATPLHAPGGLEACREMRERGNALFRAGDIAGAAREYTAALELATAEQRERELSATRAAATRDSAAQSQLAAAAGAAAEQRARALCNLASCHLRLSRPADALAAAAEAMDACSERDAAVWERKLRTGPGWSDWTRDAYCRAVLRRAQAAQAAGVPALAQPDVHWAAQAASKEPPLADVALRRELALRDFDLMGVLDASPAPGAAARDDGSCLVRGAWARVATARGTAAPPPRRGGAAAAVAGWFYVLGGMIKEDMELMDEQREARARDGYSTEDEIEHGVYDNDNFSEELAKCAARDCWRISVAAVVAAADSPAAPRPAWQQLQQPSRAGGPPACEHTHAAACDALALLVVYANGHLYTLPVPPEDGSLPDTGTSWRRLGCPWSQRRALPSGDVADDEVSDHEAAMCVGGCFSYVYWEPEGLRAMCLRTGAPALRVDPRGGGPARCAPHMWVASAPPPGQGAAADARIRLWGGAEPGQELMPQQPGFTSMPCMPVNSDMWICEAGVWQRVRPLATGGGGVPPLTRAEALCMPRDDGSVLLVGGYSETHPWWLPGMRGQAMGFRYFHDAHLFTDNLRSIGSNDEGLASAGDARAGWCPVATPRTGRPPTAAQRVGSWDAHSRAALVAGGYSTLREGHFAEDQASGNPHRFPLTDIFVLRLDDDATRKPACCASCGATGGRLRACSRCRRVRYCGELCQRTHWAEHKRDCSSAD